LNEASYRLFLAESGFGADSLGPRALASRRVRTTASKPGPLHLAQTKPRFRTFQTE